jgi:pectate lyase
MKTTVKVLAALAAAALAGCAEPQKDTQIAKLPDGRQLAFPTAEGFGAAAAGGRGGKAIYVTNLKESGVGSLRACVETKGPRTCIFRTGGTITLKKDSLKVTEPFLTIAGETAPGGGIALRNGPRQPRPSLEILTHDVIVRHIRMRPGPHDVKACCAGAIGLYTADAHDIMLDHISASWGSDETVDSEEATNFTFQWGIVSEPLLDGGPGKSDRARNMLFTKSGNVTVHHSLFAMGRFRNPQIKPGYQDAVADVVNNVLYSPEWIYVMSFGDEWSAVKANVVGNFKIAGANAASDRMVHLFKESGKGFSVYSEGNYDETYIPAGGADQREALDPADWSLVSPSRFPAPAVLTTSAETAYAAVLARAGATRPKRDEVDARIVEAVNARSGGILKTHPEDVGGWPELEAGEPYADLDGDGVSDEWERARKTNLNDPSDGAKDSDGDGWTNLEEFLHYLAGDVSAP